MLPYPGPGSRWTISAEGGTEPVWSRDGKELFYIHDDELVAVEIDADSGFSVGTSHKLFRRPHFSVAAYSSIRLSTMFPQTAGNS